jgi:hypothetical protein
MDVKGMVLVAGKTYRITRLMPRLYEAVRILDDALIGQFRCGPALELIPVTTDTSTLRLVAREAIMKAKTSWVGSLQFD